MASRPDIEVHPQPGKPTQVIITARTKPWRIRVGDLDLIVVVEDAGRERDIPDEGRKVDPRDGGVEQEDISPEVF